MPSGRPPKPVEHHVSTGNYRPSRHGPIVDPDAGAAPPPAMPADLDGPAAAFWREMVRVLAGVLTERDGPILAELCRWHVELTRTEAELRKAKPGSVEHGRLLRSASKCSDTFTAIGRRFGLTPADRARIPAAPAAVRARVATRQPTKNDLSGPPT